MYKAQLWVAIVAGIEISLASCKLSTSQSWPGNSSTTLPSVFPLLEDVGSADLFPMPLCGTFKLEEATIDEMQAALAAGTLTSQQLVGCYIQRTYRTQEYIHSILQINPDVFQLAAKMYLERKAGKIRGPLHGIPFTVKDNIASKDNMETTAGSFALLGSIVPRDAHVVKRLREAGAILFGKAALSEWADMRSNNYSEGFSARGGQCRSPYNFTLNPGGSSTGSAVGVAANAIAFSLGTETDGSVINPAERNAIVGFKPTVGLTSRAGVVPESEHQDSVGTFGRTVRDAVYAFDAIYGIDERDNYTLAQEGKTPEGGYTQFLSTKEILKGATFGLPWNSFWALADDEQRESLEQLLKLITSAGATIINNTEITDYETIVSPDGWDWDYGTTRGYPNESEYTVVKVDFYNNINTYLSELENTDIKTFEDIIAFNYDNDGTEGGHPWPLGTAAFYSGQDGFLASLESKGIKDKTYLQAIEFSQQSTRNGINDALTSPNGTKLAGLLVPPDVGQTYQIAAQAGYPMITLPAGVRSSTGMGFGLAIMQTAYGEAELVKWGSAIEDLQLTTEGNPYKRTLPNWYEYLTRNVPVF
ncbi:amidase [Colletotrichum scovillei]|uniref:Amidase n=1 Tax=Colletotrichum scovillei TaxID=1209932 RepID=A0A9P7UE08_9PEZI|nr:amidase [Colletotrichum scovillei]KAF4783522.1 amidase [Colletotrichum scovillei]KAG7053063.1 amidase [Colletotrichum scovillei]KAG7071354.1 amidase [Colletotrichum scovillei]KAG7079634.1 amidase [Colletotrichum scovillei]